MIDIETYEFPERLSGRRMVGDAESNGLLEQKKVWKSKELIVSAPADKIWMICHIDPETKECWDFIADDMLKLHGRALKRHNRMYGRKDVHLLPLSLLPKYWDLCGEQYFHNMMKFDAPLVEKLMGYHLDRLKRKDTLLMSQTLNCDREYVNGSTSGPHSVESWALRLGKGSKVEHEDWMNFSIDMYRRCYRDVEIQADILVALEGEIRMDKVECNIDWTNALHTEHMAAFWIAYSEQWGFPCDVAFTEQLVETLDDGLEVTEDELLPDMPFRQDMSAGCGIGTLNNWEDYSAQMLKNTGMSQLPLGWCWPEEGRNRQAPLWKPFDKSGEYTKACRGFWEGLPAEPEVPAEPERFFVKSVKAKKAKYNKDGELISEAVEEVKGVRARKAQDAIPAKPRKPSCYEDEAGLTSETLHKCKLEDVVGPFTRLQYINYDLGSNAQVIEYLQKFTSWVHTEETEKGNPKLTEDSFDSIGSGDLGIRLKNYIIDKSRRTNIKNFKDPSKGWLNLLRDDGRITPINHTMGTPTARSRHANLVNVPSGGARWGHEMRKCWTAYSGGLMLGSDAAGLTILVL